MVPACCRFDLAKRSLRRLVRVAEAKQCIYDRVTSSRHKKRERCCLLKKKSCKGLESHVVVVVVQCTQKKKKVEGRIKSCLQPTLAFPPSVSHNQQSSSQSLSSLHAKGKPHHGCTTVLFALALFSRIFCLFKRSCIHGCQRSFPVECISGSKVQHSVDWKTSSSRPFNCVFNLEISRKSLTWETALQGMRRWPQPNRGPHHRKNLRDLTGVLDFSLDRMEPG